MLFCDLFARTAPTPDPEVVAMTAIDRATVGMITDPKPRRRRPRTAATSQIGLADRARTSNSSGSAAS